MARRQGKTKEELYNAFVADVLAKVPAAKRDAIKQVLDDEDFATTAREGVLARADYSRSMDELAASRQTFEDEVEEARSRIQGWTEWYQGVAQDTATMRDRIAQYEAAFGRLDPEVRRALQTGQGNPKYLTAEDFNTALQAELQKRDASAIAVADVLTDLKIQHQKDFSERLDTKALLKIATDRNIPLDVAYQQLVGPALEDKRQKDLDARIAKAKEEGAAEALSKHHLPVVPGPTAPHPIDNVGKIPQGATGQRDRVSAAVADWNSQSHTA